MAITIRKIAELAGVSRGTVDKVLHNRAGVSDKMRERIWKIIKENEYQPRAWKRQYRKPQRQKPICVILPSMQNPFFQQVFQGMQDAAQLYRIYDMQVKYLFCETNRVSELVNLLEALPQTDYSGMVLRGMQDVRLQMQLEAFHTQSFPVVLFDSDIPRCPKLCFVGENGKTSGHIAASLLAKSIGGEGQVAIIGGQHEVEIHRLRTLGFQEVLTQRYPKITLVETVETQAQAAMTYDRTLNLLKRYPDLRGIFSSSGFTGEVGQALLDSGVASTIKVVSYNFTSDIMALLQRGTIDFTIGLAPYQQGYVAIQTLMDFVVHGQKPASRFIEISTLIGIEENIQSLLKENAI